MSTAYLYVHPDAPTPEKLPHIEMDLTIVSSEAKFKW